jgi:hypothetical protein
MLAYSIDDVQQEFYLDHRDCLRDQGVIGAYSILLDRYQLDELNRNHYTMVTEDCMYCSERSTFLVKKDPCKR